MAGNDPLSEPALRAAALAYLARYAASASQLARVLDRRRIRHGDGVETPREIIAARIAAIVSDLVRVGLVDDASYASMKAAGLQRRGASNRRIVGVLREKGIADDLIDAALRDLDRDYGPDRERIAALRLARRRRLGPWSRDDLRIERRMRSIASLARAGFAPALATWAIDCARDEAEALLEADSH